MADPKATKHHGVPLTLIEEAAKSYATVLIYISRRSADGKLRSIGNTVMDTVKLADIEGYLQTLGGGGTYTVRPVRVDNHLAKPEPLDTFDVSVEGPPKPVTARENGIDATAGMSATMPYLGGAPDMSAIPSSPYRPLTPEERGRLPDWVHSLPLHMQHDFLSKQQPHRLDPSLPQPAQYVMQQPNTKYTSDELAFEQTKHFRDELMELKKKQELREEDWRKKEADLAKRLDDEKEARRDAAHRGELAVMAAKLEALSQRPPAEPPKPAFNLMEWTPLIIGLVPVLQAVVTSGNQRAAATAEQQQKSFETQMTGISNMMKLQVQPKDSNKDMFETVVKLAPLLAPVVSKFIESRGPEAQANMWATNAENQLNMIAMIGQLTQELAKTGAGGGEPWYLPMVQNLLGTVMTGVQAMVDGQKKSNPMGPEQRQLPAGTVEQESSEFTPGQRVAKMIFDHPQFPAELKTQEWFDVVGALHDNTEPKEMATMFSDLLIKLENDEKIPQIIQADWEKDPKQVLLNICNMLPVGQQNPDYVNTVVDNVMEMLEAATDDEEATEETAEAKPPFNPPKQKAPKQPSAS